MPEKLSLKRPTKVATEIQPSQKPTPSEKAKKDYENFGKIVTKLIELGYKIQISKPLSKMIYRQIKNALPKDFMSNSDIYDAIGYHVRSPKYLLKLRPDAQRLDIKGKKDGKVTPEESKFALETLYAKHGKLMRERRKKKANPIKAKRGNSRVQYRKNK